MATNYLDSIGKRVRCKQLIAENAYKIMAEFLPKEEKENRKEILDEILEQIEVCEGLCVPVSVEQILEWLKMESVHEVNRAARKLKFAS